MPAWYLIAIKADGKDATFLQRQILPAKTFGASGKTTARTAAKEVADLMRSIVGGAQSGQIYLGAVSDASTRAVGTITCTQANAAGDTVTWTYAGLTVVLTEGVDFVRGASDATAATNLAAAINANYILKGIYAATVAANVVTLTLKLPPSSAGNITITTSDATAFALVQPTGGALTGGTVFFQNFETGKTP